jgi:exopolysaccharide production protein ExoQ
MESACFLLPLIAVLVPYGVPLWAGVCAATSLMYLYQNNLKPSLTLGAVSVPLLGVLAWMGVSCFWAPDAPHALALLGKIVAMALAGVCISGVFKNLPPEKTDACLRALLMGFIIALIWAAFDRHFEGYMRAFFKREEPSSDLYERLLPYNMGATSLVIFLWPALWGLAKGKKYLGFIVIGATALTLKDLYSHSALWGLFVGLFFFMGTFVLRKIFLYTTAACLFFAVLGAPQLTLHVMDPVVLEEKLPQGAKPSYIHRVWIWQYVAHKILEKPFAGWGLDASRHETLKQGLLWGSQRFCIPYEGKIPYDSCLNEALPLHPHNVALQIWLELGAVGAALFAFFFSGVLVSIGRANVNRSVQATFAATFGSGFFISSTAYGMWQSWWVASLIFGAGLLMLVSAQDKRVGPS